MWKFGTRQPRLYGKLAKNRMIDEQIRFLNFLFHVFDNFNFSNSHEYIPIEESSEYSNRCLLPSRPGEKNVEQRNPKGFCCGGKAYDRIAGRECCGGKIFYARKHICCGGNIETNTKDYKCCGGILIKVSTQVCCGGIPSEKNAGKKCCNVRGEVKWYDQWEEVCLSNGIRRKKSRTEEQCGTRDTFDPAEQPKAECCRGRKFDIVCKFKLIIN